MQNVNSTLVLFTAQFPFGQVSETFLETEIEFLSQKFETIYIITSSKNDLQRKLPENVIVRTDFTNYLFSKSQKIKTLFFNLPLVCSVLTSEMKDKGWRKCIQNKNVLLDYLVEQLFFQKKIKDFVLKQKKGTVFYDYWFCNKTLALAMLKKKNRHLKFVSRAHGFDLYDERWGEVGIPFRRFKSKYIDKIYFISQEGFNYFKTKVEKSIEKKMNLSRLGVLPNQASIVSMSDIPLIISISRVVSFKNIHQIPFLLSQLDRPFKWIHFGDGEDISVVKEACEKYLKEDQYELKGHVANEELITFLQHNKVDLLLSLSSSEGLPVSMMEVQSFGIPILSTPVGGIPEIVINEKTGFLFSTDENEMESLNKSLDNSFSKDEIISFFNEHFNATVNYSKFVNDLCCLEN